jgi:hypothetical protein
MANPIQVTEMFSGKGYSLESPWAASRSFMVTGVSNDYDALRAVDYQTGLGVPQADDPITPGSSILAKGPRVSEVLSTDVRIITMQYAVPQDGTWVKNDLDPLKEPAEVQWDPGEISFPVDLDLDGRPIINTAGDPFDPPTRRIKYKRLTIYKNELYYNINKANTFENTVNSAAVNLSGVTTVGANYMYCSSIGPAERYKVTAKYIKMAYSFDLIMAVDLGKHPWQYAYLNVGRNGWVTINGKKLLGAFVTQPEGTGTAAIKFEQDVRLDLTGKPISALYPNLKIGKEGLNGSDTFAQPPETAPTSAGPFYMDQETVSYSGSLHGYRLYFRQFYSKDLNLLGL